MRRCGICGTLEPLTTLLTQEEKRGFTVTFLPEYECADDNECYRRAQMNMFEQDTAEARR